MSKIRGNTIFFDNNKVFIAETSTIAGTRESEGPLSKFFDKHLGDDCLKQKSHEDAEASIHVSSIKLLLNKAKLTVSDIDIALCGDLLDELLSSNFAMRELKIPYLGIYNACATFGEGLLTAATFIDGGYADKVIVSTTSHFCTAERQYRFPLELGSQRTPLSQWTVTGAGATLLTSKKTDINVECATIGIVQDFGITDSNNMGAAMAPAAYDTLKRHFHDTGRSPDYYDIILTGDLGEVGKVLLIKMMQDDGIDISKNYDDCGSLIFNRVAQDVGQGGSGAVCSNLVFNGFVYKKMMERHYKRVLLLPTGALVSKTSALQGNSIPSICHAVSLGVV